MISRRKFLKMGLAAGAALTLSSRDKELIHAIAHSPGSYKIQAVAAPYPTWPMQTLLPGKTLPQFVEPLPVLNYIAAGADQIELHMREFKYNVLPANFILPNNTPYGGTWVWGYRQPGQPDGSNSFIGPVVIATRDVPTEIKFVNDLTTGADTNVLAYKYSVDQTLHWAAPTGMITDPDGNMCMALPMGTLPSGDCADTYKGPIPTVPHLHGGEVPAALDGGPDAWFTGDGQYHGKAFYTGDGSSSNYCVYRYPNKQEAALIWFHDHALGATRVNVYCGLAGAYLLTDPALQLPANLDKLPLVPLVIQDRSFDTNGQFLLPAGPPFNPNPDHPYWVPEFVGDSVLVNGKLWPFLQVEPRRYRFLIINGSNARTYEMFLVNPVSKVMGPPLWQIGTDGGYLDSAVKIDPNAAKGSLQRLVMMPGERADIIVDFTHYAGQTLIVKNVAKTPYPGGETPDGNTIGKIIQIRVNLPLSAPDDSYNPAVTPVIRQAGQKIIRLSSPTVMRQLTLNEIMGMPITTTDPVTGLLTAFPGGPLEILVNNTKWAGKGHMDPPRPDFTQDKIAYVSELPEEGTTELWEIVNLTADAHPIHLHLVQFQAVNRQNFDVNKYNAVYSMAFPGGMFMPAYGPPLDYNTGNPTKKGGNPDVTPFLKSVPIPVAPNEAGWKDTIQCPPGMVTRFLVRFAPTDLPVAPPEGTTLTYPFDPGNQDGTGSDYVWHCHIIDHEDNEMMRPYTVNPAPDAERSYNQGTDY